MGKFVISKRANGDFQFILLASNGQVILSSQGYSSKASCDNGIQSVMINSQYESRFERLTSSSGKYYFNLKSQNGQVIGSSAMYESEAGRENGIVSVMHNAKSAEQEVKY
jgi:uncharacterized protein YegP (UPF0339 family)